MEIAMYGERFRAWGFRAWFQDQIDVHMGCAR